MGILLAIVLFSVIVIIHEFGHFLFAKLNGIEVFEFSLGMGPKLVSKQIGKTLYCIKLFPLGGSCMMGEDELEEKPSEEAIVGDNAEDSVDEGIERRIGNFNEKSVGARMSVIVGGPLFNFLLAWICAVVMVIWVGVDTSEIGAVVDESPAQEAGLQAGDEITEMNGRNVHLFREILAYNQFNPGETVTVEYSRDGEKNEVVIEPVLNKETGGYFIGISASPYEKTNVIESLQYGVYTVRYWIYTVLDSLKMMVTGHVSMNDIAGPVGIVNIVGDTYQQSAKVGWDMVVLNMLNLTVLLSANLGVMNLLPFPALDGGRLVFLILEAIRGKRISPEREGMFHFIGFATLMVLMVVVLFNDVLRIFQ